MGTDTDTSPAHAEDKTPEYLEHSAWPVLIAMAIGVAMVGLFLLVKGFILPAAILMMFSFGAVLAGFLYSDTRNWRRAISKSPGRTPPGTNLGPFPVDISLTIQLIILTEILLFGGAFAVYFAIRLQFPVWPPAGAPILDDSIARIQTLILISSSVLVEWAIWQLKTRKPKSFQIRTNWDNFAWEPISDPPIRFRVATPHL